MEVAPSREVAAEQVAAAREQETIAERRRRKEKARLANFEKTRVRSRATVPGRGRGRPRKLDAEIAAAAGKRPTPGELERATKMITRMKAAGIIKNRAREPKLNVVACAIALYLNEPFTDDTAAKLLFNVGAQTNVRGEWIDGCNAKFKRLAAHERAARGAPVPPVRTRSPSLIRRLSRIRARGASQGRGSRGAAARAAARERSEGRAACRTPGRTTPAQGGTARRPAVQRPHAGRETVPDPLAARHDQR